MNAARTAIALVLTALPLLVVAQAPPNFTGTWKCDVQRSTGCSDNTVAVIKQNDDVLTMTIGKGPTATFRVGQTITSDPTTATTRTGEKAPQSKTTARWEGSVLVTEVATVEPQPRVALSTWRLSPDAKELTIDVKRTGPNVQPSSKYVYVKTAP